MKAIRNAIPALTWNIPWWLSIMMLVLVGFGFFGYLGCAQKSGAIVRGVYIDRINLAGLTREEAKTLLKNHYEPYLARPINLADGELRPSFIPKDVGISMNYDGMAESANRLGHHGSLLRKIWERLFLSVRPDYLPLKIKINQPMLEDFYQELELQVNIEPQQVRFNVDPTGKITQRPSRIGKKLNLPALTRAIGNTLWREDNRVVELPVQTIRPGLMESDIQSWSFDTVIGIYTTRFKPKDVDRSNNLQIAAAALDNCLVVSGQTFSFNKQVGPRVQAAGYREAPVIVKGKLIPGIGGGVCQVSGTLYNALLFGGFTKFGRWNHSLPSAYVPLGRDATVVYGGQDFTFTNTLKTPVMITTAFNPAGALTIAILGRKEGDFKIRLDSVVKKMIPFTIQETVDPTLALGERKVEEEGKNGYQVEVWRTWLGPDQKFIRRERVSMNFYPPMPSVVKVGTLTPQGQTTNTVTATNASVVQTPNANPITKVSD